MDHNDVRDPRMDRGDVPTVILDGEEAPHKTKRIYADIVKEEMRRR